MNDQASILTRFHGVLPRIGFDDDVEFHASLSQVLCVNKNRTSLWVRRDDLFRSCGALAICLEPISKKGSHFVGF